ncbi:GNAT family N-acetyltransferase [Staphylococcus simulans]|uniref:GNAT family N-acetyltransferase n=1 Tax=Staphylococcus simulans TaxID=1286 RepID=UPI0028A50B8F|nr:GNAT family N-acetyltransferase [Staphylococcus simulans]MDT4012236.1 GNAT family N-acetyltransferase [Staphylococcus simulans]
MAEIKHRHNKFYVGDSEENPDAEMTYVPTGKDKIIIDHTGVDESLRGQGIAKQLVEAGVNYARENDIKILATCPFAKQVLEETPEYHDVLLKG